MSRVCDFCGKKTGVGHRISRRGKAKKEGGVGKKITGITNRHFRPNLQKVHAVVPGKGVARVRVCAQCLRSGVIAKPLRAAKKA